MSRSALVGFRIGFPLLLGLVTVANLLWHRASNNTTDSFVDEVSFSVLAVCVSSLINLALGLFASRADAFVGWGILAVVVVIFSSGCLIAGAAGSPFFLALSFTTGLVTIFDFARARLDTDIHELDRADKS